jgi:cholesterol oxidase
VCAARLAQAGAQVVVLERGREFSPTGNRFPDTSSAIRSEVQLHGGPFDSRSRLGLFDIHVNRDLDVFVGCGLGGTSLINASVMIRPDPRVLQRTRWPRAIREAAAAGDLDMYYQRAHDVLQPSQYPTSRTTPRKLAAMVDNGADRAHINVHFDGTHNSVGVPQTPCHSCGDCMTGCNTGAKKTLCYTYLPIAKSYGAKIFVQCEVDHIEPRADGRWDVIFQRLETGREAAAFDRRITAKTVIIGGGVLGSSGILMRSQRSGLPLSPNRGGRLSGNGDAFAFAYNCDDRLDSVGHGDDPTPPVGASILSVIDRRATPDVDDGIIIQEGAFPTGMAGLLRVLLQVIAATGEETHPGWAHWFHEQVAEGRDLFGDKENGALNRTLVFLLMGHDGADGLIELDDCGRPAIRWPQLHERDLFTAENALARAISAKLGGIFVKDPLDTPLLLNNLITVHPLGGCGMGDDPTSGVVDHAGRVFRDDRGVYPGLYVADGSVIPTSLGVNPLWTISALAERIADHVVSDLGLTPNPLPTIKV